MELFLDFETASKVNLKKHGAAVYAMHSSTSILCMAYSVDAKETKIWQPLEPFPEELKNLKNYTVIAHNVMFETFAWNYVLRRYHADIPDIFTAKKIHCTMKIAQFLNLDKSSGASLQALSEFFGFGNKLDAGNELVKRGAPFTFDELLTIEEYCKKDVDILKQLYARIKNAPGEEDYEDMILDLFINYIGIPVDVELAWLVSNRNNVLKKEAAEELKALTSGAVGTPNQRAKILSYLADFCGTILPNLQEGTVESALANPQISKAAKEVLSIRQRASGTALKKMDAVLRRAIGAPPRIFGELDFASALTGRWAGRGVQIHNLPKAEERESFHPDLSVDKFKEALKNNGRIEKDELNSLLACIRGMIIANPGHLLIGLDFSSIEAIVLAALSGENWRIEAFKKGRDIYSLTAAAITGTPVNSDGTHPQRALGKVAELASGYGGSLGSWRAFGMREGEYSDSDVFNMVDSWRGASPAIPELWRDLESGLSGGIISENLKRIGVNFLVDSRAVTRMTLPSGRSIAYPNVGVGFEGVFYRPKEQKIKIYGGKLCENLCQATARDILAHSIRNVNKQLGLLPIFHVHDELIYSVSKDSVDFYKEKLDEIVVEPPEWAKDYPIRCGESWVGKRYRKD